MLNKESPLPRYALIAERIRRSILTGELGNGAKLPSQRELAEMYSTTVMTIRQALALLEEENLIYTLHGVGSFVSNPVVDVDHFHLVSFGDEMRQRSFRVETVLLKSETSSHYEVAARALALQPDVGLCRMQRLRSLEGEPIVYQSSFLPPWLTQVVEEYSPEEGLYDCLYKKAGQVVSMAKEVLIPTLLNPEQAAWLKRQPGEAAFSSIRLSTNPDGIPLVYDEAIMVGDRFIILAERIGHRTGFRVHLAAQGKIDLLSLLID